MATKLHRVSGSIFFKKMAITGLLFLYFRLFNTVDSNKVANDLFELQISGVRSDRSRNHCSRLTYSLLRHDRGLLLFLVNDIREAKFSVEFRVIWLRTSYKAFLLSWGLSLKVSEICKCVCFVGFLISQLFRLFWSLEVILKAL